MALRMAEVPEKPDLICLGEVREVGEPKLSESGSLYYLPIEIQSAQAPDATFYFLFRPEWFRADFDPSVLRQQDEQARKEAEDLGETPPPSQYALYCRFIAYQGQPAALQILAGDQFEKLASTFDQIPPDQITPEIVAAVLREFLVGNEVGYILRQRRDRETRELTEYYGIHRLFPAERYKDYERPNPRRRHPAVVTWLEED